MRITRRFHSCIELIDAHTTLIVDPGSFAVPDNLADADAILITHTHPDHVDVDALARARELNPDLPIIGPAGLTELTDLSVQVAHDGDRLSVGSFAIEVRAFEHATIIRSKTLPENLGYIFNDRVMHPGDSFPELTGMEVVFVPVSGPWMRMLNVDEYLEANRPTTFIGVHDGIDNDFGLAIRRGLLTQLADDHGLSYVGLRPGESLEI